MTEKPMTPLEQFQADQQRAVVEGSRRPGAEGAFYRLCSMLDPQKISEWVEVESRRGTPYEDQLDAITNFMANVAIPLAIVAGTHTVQQLEAIFQNGLVNALNAIDDGLPILMVNRNDGRQVEATSHGLLAGNFPKETK